MFDFPEDPFAQQVNLDEPDATAQLHKLAREGLLLLLLLLFVVGCFCYCVMLFVVICCCCWLFVVGCFCYCVMLFVAAAAAAECYRCCWLSVILSFCCRAHRLCMVIFFCLCLCLCLCLCVRSRVVRPHRRGGCVSSGRHHTGQGQPTGLASICTAKSHARCGLSVCLIHFSLPSRSPTLCSDNYCLFCGLSVVSVR